MTILFCGHEDTPANRMPVLRYGDEITVCRTCRQLQARASAARLRAANRELRQRADAAVAR